MSFQILCRGNVTSPSMWMINEEVLRWLPIRPQTPDLRSLQQLGVGNMPTGADQKDGLNFATGLYILPLSSSWKVPGLDLRKYILGITTYQRRDPAL